MHKNGRESRAETDATLRVFLDAMPGPAILIGRDGLVLEVNEPMAARLRKDRSELVGRSVFAMLPPEIAAARAARFEKVLKTGRPEIFEDNRDGSIFRNTMFPILDDRNKVDRVAIFVEDITERLRTAEALAGSEQRFRELANTLPIAIFEADPTGRVIFANRTAFDWFGYDEPDLAAGASMDQFLVEGERPRARENFTKVLSSSSVSSGEYAVMRKDGSVFSALITARPIQGKGASTGLRAVVVDITERKASETALRESEEKYRGLVEQSLIGIGQSEGNRVFFANRPLLDIFGYESLDEMASIPLIDHVAPSSKPMILDRIRRLAAGQPVATEFEYDIRRKDGAIRTLLAVTARVESEGRAITQTVFQDITERKRSEESLRRSEAQLRRTLRDAIDSLSSAIEMRDPYTAGHQARVTKLAVAIGRKMGLPESGLEALQIAGMVHDIGKLGIPAEILSKPSVLTAVEFDLIRTHPETGFRILNKISFPWPIAEIVYQHHERLDGSGYPRGLAGSAVSLEARILAVADTMEAMASHRPYRPALGIDAAFAEIKRNRGGLFDSDVVTACERVFQEDHFGF